MEPRGTSLEERKDIMKPRDCTMCQHQGQGLKKNHQIKIKSPQIKAIMTDNTRTRGRLKGLRLIRPWMSSMTRPHPKKAI